MTRCRLLFRALMASVSIAAIMMIPIARAFADNAAMSFQDSFGNSSRVTPVIRHHIHRPKQTYVVVVAPSSELMPPFSAPSHRTAAACAQAALPAPLVGLDDRPPV